MMTSAIFCSLAFCAFQMVFADELVGNYSASSYTPDQTIYQVNVKLYTDIYAAADAVKSEEITSDEISLKCTSTDADKRWVKSFDTKRDKCQQCFHTAKINNDIQSAENCCKKITEELKKDAKLYLAQAKTCIADVAKKCAKSATDCRKEATNVDEAQDKVMEDARRRQQKHEKLDTKESNKPKNV